MVEEIYYQDNKGSILTLDKMALISCSDIVVKKKYNVLEYDLDTEVLFTVENEKDITIHGTLWRKDYLGWDISRGKIMPITMWYNHEDIAKRVVSSNKNLLEGKVLVNLIDGKSVFEYDINFDKLLRKLHIKGGN